MAYAAKVSGVNISIHDLRAAVAILLDNLEDQLGPTVDLDADYYWAVDPDAAFALGHAPAPDPTVGSLSDGVETVRSAVEDGVHA